MSSRNKMKYAFLVLLFVAAFLERTLFDLGPNMELITAAMLLSAFYIGTKESFLLTFAIIALTDFFLGNTNIFLFTWTGFLIPALLAGFIFKKKNASGAGRIALGTIAGMGFTLFFYIWTNFGVWTLDVWGMYPSDLSGLMMSYINGLPFLRMHVISTLLFVPSGFAITEVAIALFSNRQNRPTYSITSSAS